MSVHAGHRLMMGLALAVGAGHAAAAGAAPAGGGDKAPVRDPVALEALSGMATYLRGLETWSMTARIAKDRVIDGGGKLQFDYSLHARYVKGEGLFIDSASAQSHRQYFYDHKAFSLYSPDQGYYATVAAPTTIGATLREIYARYGVELPLADLFYWSTDKMPIDGIEGAIVVGPGRAGGRDCRHYAYRQPDVDWQLCIAEGERPLPVKLLLTTTSLAEQPEYIAWIDWDLKSDSEGPDFTFEAPKDAHRIEFRPLTSED